MPRFAVFWRVCLTPELDIPSSGRGSERTAVRPSVHPSAPSLASPPPLQPLVRPSAPSSVRTLPRPLEPTRERTPWRTYCPKLSQALPQPHHSHSELAQTSTPKSLECCSFFEMGSLKCRRVAISQQRSAHFVENNYVFKSF